MYYSARSGVDQLVVKKNTRETTKQGRIAVSVRLRS